MVYIHDLSYGGGEHRTAASLKEEGVSRERILQLLVRGADGYCRRTDALLTVAIDAAEATLQKSKVDRDLIGVLLLGTNSLRAPDFDRDFGHALITRLRLKNAYVQLVGFQNCGDSIPILITAKALIQSGAANNILVLIADDVTAAGVPRILKDSYLHSDGAAAGLVSREGPGFSLGASKIYHAPPMEETADPYDLEANLNYLLDKAVHASMGRRAENDAPRFVITHNMNRLFNQAMANAFRVPVARVYGYFQLGHCLAADALINMFRMEAEQELVDGEQGIVVVPTSRSIGVLDIEYKAQSTKCREFAEHSSLNHSNPPLSVSTGTAKQQRDIGEYRSGVRESMAPLPGWLQPLITLITGKPLPNERPRFSPSPFVNFVLTMLVLVGMMAGNLYLFANDLVWGIIALPFTWVICTGLLRKIQVVFAHHCVHRTFILHNPAANDLMLNVLTTIPLVQHGEEYRRDHFAHHSRALFTTKEDADAALLFSLGFIPGEKKTSLWRRLVVVLFSPRLHWIFLSSRFRSNFVRRSLAWRLVSIGWAAAITVGLGVATTWWHVALVVWLPLFILYNASALLQFLTEHAWMITEKSPRNIEAYAERCWGRFFGDPCPSEAHGVTGAILWAKWFTKMIFVHAPIRFGCFVGDLPAHDWHHLCSFKNSDSATWPVAIFSRQSMIDSGNGFGMERRELWGLSSMLNHVFALLETADKGAASEEAA